MNLEYWKQQIITRRKQTSFRDFLKEIASWFPFAFYQRGGVITSLPKTDRINSVVLSSEEFEGSRDELQKKAKVYDFEKTFFENYRELYLSIPLYNLFSFGSENAQYGDNVYNSRNVYLSNGVVHDCENILYSFYIKLGCSNVLNSFMVWDTSDNVYFGAGVLQSYNIFYARYIYNCNNIWFSSNLTGCSECIFCDHLENTSYCIRNTQLSKEEYLKQKAEILQDKHQYFEYYMNLRAEGLGPFCQNSTGRFIPLCEDVENGYFSYNVHSGKNIIFMGSNHGNKDFYDAFGGG
ncbi:MAG: hypothetical protein H6767_04965 [Candidatus Peribacteria bacterium]|nr:MAG: hypothetical protein H6767_04965 [Candidatus Peribacteria bacterium]